MAASLPRAAAQDNKPKSPIYEDDRIRVAVPAGWTAAQVTVTPENSTTSQVIGAVLSKGKYRIYLLTHYGQASGVEGGRFSEISDYVAPWMKVDDPWGCFDSLTATQTTVTKALTRIDLFFDSASVSPQADDDCKHLHTPAREPVWFGSFFSQPMPGVRYGFFLTFPLGQNQVDSDHEMAFTATIDTKNPESLPAKSDPELNEFLRQASKIVNSIEYKQ